MLEGAVILLIGLGIGYYLGRRQPTVSTTEDRYEKYRNSDGLFSARAVRK